MESPIRSLGLCSRGNGINASIQVDANINNGNALYVLSMLLSYNMFE